MSPIGFGLLGGPVVAGVIRRHSDTYREALCFAGAAFAASAAAMTLSLRTAHASPPSKQAEGAADVSVVSAQSESRPESI